MEYDEDFILQINNNVNLLEYIQPRIQLKKRGKYYFGSCPLHVDKTPSFSVTPVQNRFYCFSCGKGGGIIQFLIHYEGWSYGEAVQKASNLAHMDLNKMCKSKTVNFLRQTKKIKTVSPPEPHLVLSTDEIEKYRKGEVTEWINEGISQKEIDIFNVRLDDRSNRIVYPVYDINSNLINIKGRTRNPNYEELHIPKYINYFKVGTQDYFQGLNITLPYILEKNEIIIFESIKSIMKLMKFGVNNSVSAETHYLTDEQIKLLIGLRVNIVLAYDSDVSYNHNKVQKNISKLKRFLNVFIIRDPQGLLGGAKAKNSPIDCGYDIWKQLYSNKSKII